MKSIIVPLLLLCVGVSGDLSTAFNNADYSKEYGHYYSRLPGDLCSDLPTWVQLKAALSQARNDSNGGFNLNMWGAVVNRDGYVCAISFTGEQNRGDQWPGSRVIAAQKANTANSFSLPHFAFSTANLFTAVQGGNSLYGLQFSNPVDPTVAYHGNSQNYGQWNDPMTGKKIGGVNVFGGGLALYNANGALIGGLGVSGDSSCADHNIAWRTRYYLNLDYVPQGVNEQPDKPDNIAYDQNHGWDHAHCIERHVPNAYTISLNLPSVHKA